MSPSAIFARNVKDIAAKRGIKHGDLSVHAGHSSNYLNKIARDETSIDLNSAAAIADELGFYVSALFEEGEYTKKDLVS